MKKADASDAWACDIIPWIEDDRGRTLYKCRTHGELFEIEQTGLPKCPKQMAYIEAQVARTIVRPPLTSGMMLRKRSLSGLLTSMLARGRGALRIALRRLLLKLRRWLAAQLLRAYRALSTPERM